MKTRIPLLLVSLAFVLGAVGCSAGTPKATPEQEKSFAGSAPPADYMQGVNANPKTGQGGAPSDQ